MYNINVSYISIYFQSRKIATNEASEALTTYNFYHLIQTKMVVVAIRFPVALQLSFGGKQDVIEHF